MIVIVFVVLLLLIPLLVFCIHLRLPPLTDVTQLSRDQKCQRLEQWLRQVHAAGKFNGVVLLCKDGEPVFSLCLGDDAADNPKPLTMQSSFNLASVSKQITAFGVLLLQYRGKLQVEDTIDRYLPELSGYSHVTIRHLLQHTSGLPDYMQLAQKARVSDPVFTTQTMLRLLVEQMPASHFAAGEKFSYSNTGYVLLAEIISRVSGQSFEQFCGQELFGPLAMQQTRVFNHLSADPPLHRVYGFRRLLWFTGKKRADLNQFDGVAGDGAVYSSAEDLKIWSDSLYTGTLLPQSVYQAACQSGLLNNGKPTHYGYGWFIGSDNSVEHAGSWQGFSSLLYRHLSNRDMLVILDNSSNMLRVVPAGFRFHSIGRQLKQFLADY